MEREREKAQAQKAARAQLAASQRMSMSGGMTGPAGMNSFILVVEFRFINSVW